MLQLQPNLQKTEGTAEKVDDPLILHFGKLAREGCAVDTEVDGEGIAVKGDDKGAASAPSFALRKEGHNAVADLLLA
jgi:hypothetical protein